MTLTTPQTSLQSASSVQSVYIIAEHVSTLVSPGISVECNVSPPLLVGQPTFPFDDSEANAGFCHGSIYDTQTGGKGADRKGPSFERTQRSRERNRIHARKTRQRKKEHMQYLQGRTDELKEEQIRLKQTISEKHTANILVGCFAMGTDDDGKQAMEDPVVERLLQRPADAIPDSSKIPELPALILPGQHASKKVKKPTPEDVESEFPKDGFDYELLGKDRTQCSPDELDQIRRERNRMHAKRTRDRKRLFMEEMRDICRQLEEENDLLRRHLAKIDPDYCYEPISRTDTDLSHSSQSTSATSSPKMHPSKPPENLVESLSNPSLLRGPPCSDQISTLLQAAGAFETCDASIRALSKNCVTKVLTSAIEALEWDDGSSGEESHAKRRRVLHTPRFHLPRTAASVGC